MTRMTNLAPPHSPKHEVQITFGLKIPLRDGVHLSATLYLPFGLDEPTPAILTLTPYIAQTYHEQGMYFAGRGLPFLTVDVRGRGNSEGEFRPNINEAKDGHDVVEWVAQQRFCNGRVAMWGGSYAGYDQWAAAGELPPHLATIVPAAAPFFGIDFPMRRNIASPYLMQWLTFVWGRTSQDRMYWNGERHWGEVFKHWHESGQPFKQLDTFVGHASASFQEWVSHPHQDAYYDRYNPTPEGYRQIKVPVLTITGIYDGDQPGALTHYREHLKQATGSRDHRHYLIIGPWDHAGTRTPREEFAGLKAGPASLVDLADLHFRWYAWTLQQGAKPDFLKRNVAYYVMGAERWRHTDSLEAVTARVDTLYLHSDKNPTDVFASGSLQPELSISKSPDHYIYDPSDLSTAELESTVDPENRTEQRLIHASFGKRLIYHGAPFGKPTEISGFFRLTAWIAVDQPDTDFEVSVYEIDTQGRSILMTSDCMRARYRESQRQERLIGTLDPLPYEFDQFTFVSREVAIGSRLRLVMGPINSIYRQKNYNSGKTVSEESMADARPVRVRLFHDVNYPSALYVPLAPIMDNVSSCH